MLSFASRRSHAIRHHTIPPLCRVQLNSNSFGRAVPTLLGRGFAQTQPTAVKAKPKTKAKVKVKAKPTSSPSKSTIKKASRKTVKLSTENSTDKKTPKKTTQLAIDDKKDKKPSDGASTAPAPTSTSQPKKKAAKRTPLQPLEASTAPAPASTSQPKKKAAKRTPLQPLEASTAPAPASTSQPKKKAAKRTSLQTPEDLSGLWEKSMDIVSNLNKIGPTKLTDSQRILMAGTLDVIKTVLTSRVRKIAQADGKTQSSVDMASKSKNLPDSVAKTDESTNIVFEDGVPNESPNSQRTDPGKSAQPKDFTSSNTETKVPGWNKKQTSSVIKMPAGGLLQPISVPTPPVPLIQYGLDRVLFNEGVYVLQDPRTGVFNFDPYLANIMPVTEFDFDSLKEYITSSKDEILLDVTRKCEKKYTGSTSSMTSTLAHFHFLLSNWRKINLARISREYEPEQQNFVTVLRAPAATFLNYNDGVYAIDADKEWDDDTILSMLGKSMEMLLTAPKSEYEKYRRTVSHKLTQEEKNKPESYHYTEFGDFVMRSQLDAYDPRLPGSGVYDLKTRAVVAIRMDAVNYEKGRSYEILNRTGEWESFEREYHDMIRGAFLKYSLQVRMGRMDGIFVAYHNTQRIFGFQYIPLEEMDHSIHGTTDKTLGDKEFLTSLRLWNIMLNKATEKFPGQSLRVHVETRPSQTIPFMYFFAEPVTSEEINKIQVRDQSKVDKFREQVLGISPPQPAGVEAGLVDEDIETEDQETQELTNEDNDILFTLDKESSNEEDSNGRTDSDKATEEQDNEEVWANMMAVVEETMENDVQGITAIRDAIEEALQQSGLLKARSSEDAQHYIDALLKAIVDVEAQRTKVETNGETTTMSSAEQLDSEIQTTQEADAAQQHAEKELIRTETQPAGEPGFGFFSKMIHPFRQSKTPTAEKPESQDAAAVQSSELVDLIIKMTSRAGVPNDGAEANQEVSDDQAKLRNFETLLSELVKADELVEAESEDTTSPTTEDQSDAAPVQDGHATAGKPVFGMILTIRNKVNSDYVDRPENLTYKDDWNIEYCMEEIPEDKVQQLYLHLKARRKKAFVKDPKSRRFDTLFGGALKRYSRKGATHRNFLNKLDAEKRPLFAVGVRQPFTADTISETTVFTGFSPDVRMIRRAKANWAAKQRAAKYRSDKIKISAEPGAEADEAKTEVTTERSQGEKTSSA